MKTLANPILRKSFSTSGEVLKFYPYTDSNKKYDLNELAYLIPDDSSLRGFFPKQTEKFANLLVSSFLLPATGTNFFNHICYLSGIGLK